MYLMICASSKDTDQSKHPCNQLRVFGVRLMKHMIHAPNIPLKSILDRYWPDRIPVGHKAVQYKYQSTDSTDESILSESKLG